MTKDMTKGNPLKLIANFTVPFLIGNLIQQFYYLISSIFVSVYVGPAALGGVGISSTVLFVTFGFVVGACNGFCITLAQRFGAKRKKGIKLSVASSVYLYVVVTLLITIVGVLSTKPILNLIDTPAENFQHAYIFTIIHFLGCFSLIAYNLLSGFLRSVGDNKTPLFFLIVSVILNIILDFITVAILNLKTAGTAISIVVSQAICCVPCLIFIYKKYSFMWPTKKEFKINRGYITAQTKIGLPMGLEFSITGIGIIILQKAVNKFGENIIAGFTIAMRIEDLIIAVFIALATATATFTAQNYGAKKYVRIKKGARASSLIGVFLCIVFSIILIMLWDPIINLFLSNDVATPQKSKNLIQDAAKQYIDIAIFNFPILCLLLIYRSIVLSLNKTLIPVLSGFCELIMRIFGAFFLTKIFGYVGICWTPSCTWYVTFIMIAGSYLFNIIKLLRVQKNAAPQIKY